MPCGLPAAQSQQAGQQLLWPAKSACVCCAAQQACYWMCTPSDAHHLCWCHAQARGSLPVSLQPPPHLSPRYEQQDIWACRTMTSAQMCGVWACSCTSCSRAHSPSGTPWPTYLCSRWGPGQLPALAPGISPSMLAICCLDRHVPNGSAIVWSGLTGFRLLQLCMCQRPGMMHLILPAGFWIPAKPGGIRNMDSK